jgi:hypothetical protein
MEINRMMMMMMMMRGQVCNLQLLLVLANQSFSGVSSGTHHHILFSQF